MANYTIIGGDGKEYGPVTESDIKQWIAEGRLNADSRAKGEGDAEFRALAQFPEFASVLKPQAAPATISPVKTTDDFFGRDYELDIGGCISRGWELYKGHFGVIFGSFIIMILVQAVCGGMLGLVRLPFNNALLHAPAVVQVGYNYVSSVALSLVTGPLMGGVFLVYLKTIRGQAAGVGEMFEGFQRAYLQLFLGYLMMALIFGGCLLPFQFVWYVKAAPLLEQMQHMQGDPAAAQNLLPQLISATTSSLPVLCICLVPFTFFTVCFQFTLPLIIDRQMDFGTALKASFKMVLRHWWHVFGLTVLAGLLGLLGALGCCIGALFTMPIGMLALMYAYETIFSAQKD